MKKVTMITTIVMSMIVQVSAQPGLKINEIDYDQPGTDDAEFIELVNTDSLTVDLGLYSVMLINGLSATVYDSIALPSQNLGPGEFFVICGNAGTVINCDLVYPAASDIIQNGSPDAIALVENSSSNIVDVFSYEGSVTAPYVEGTGLPTGQSDNNTDVYFGISRYPDGYDTQNNSTDFIPACITPGTANTNIDTSCQVPTAVHYNAMPDQRMFVFPNPAASVVSFFGLPAAQSTSTWEIIFSDVTGKCVKKIFASAPDKIINTNVSSLQSGMYLVTARNAHVPGFTGALKLIVTR